MTSARGTTGSRRPIPNTTGQRLTNAPMAESRQPTADLLRTEQGSFRGNVVHAVIDAVLPRPETQYAHPAVEPPIHPAAREHHASPISNARQQRLGRAVLVG